jgi:hypothetical protein
MSRRAVTSLLGLNRFSVTWDTVVATSAGSVWVLAAGHMVLLAAPDGGRPDAAPSSCLSSADRLGARPTEPDHGNR